TQSIPDESIISIQNNWHERGNNGCIFSQIIAQKPEKYHWKADIAPPLETDLATHIDQTIQTAVENPDIRLLSILFPEITSVKQLSQLIGLLNSKTQTLFLENTETHGSKTALGYRIPLCGNTVTGWVMG